MDTYMALAESASKKLERDVTVTELAGQPLSYASVPIQSFVGAGEEVFTIPSDGPIGYTQAPPGMEDCEATEVRGQSMIPLYHNGDLLFHRRIETNIGRYRNQVVVVQIKGDRRLVKQLVTGSKPGRFHLASFNQAFPLLEDQPVEWVGPIEWVRKMRRV